MTLKEIKKRLEVRHAACHILDTLEFGMYVGLLLFCRKCTANILGWNTCTSTVVQCVSYSSLILL
jgi:hypothetical protein